MGRARTRAVAVALLSTAILSGCGAGLFDTPPELRGVWRTDGYGRILDIRTRSVAVYDVTETTCVLSETFDFAGPVLHRWRTQIVEGGRALRFAEPAEAHMVRALRIAAVPERCVAGTPATAPDVFAAFTEAMNAHYAFFDLHGVDWPARVAAARPRIRPAMPEAELFDLMAGMLAELDDGHLALRGSVDGKDRIVAPGRSRMARAVREGRRSGALPADFRFRDTHWNAWVLRDVLGGRGTQGANGRLAWGVLEGDVGYLAIRSLSGFARTEDGEAAALDRALDAAFAEFRAAGVRAVLLDLTANPGGTDAHAHAVAARFTDAAYHAYEKFAADADARVPTRIAIAPASGTRFAGPLGIATSELTGSAAEVLAMALRARPGGAVQYGEATGGAFSDVLDRRLPNGWTLELSNEVYLDARGLAWEGRGLPPDRPMAVFDPNDPSRSHAGAIRAAAAQLSRTAAPERTAP